ncbi:hypothetical protein CDAR_41091 [Caerostris darwini]|uniref:Uncharacterized protein n=1 Tax=Caerostris darwini TaxID=1538125 RepID=A0AAV4W252_9ARAC|nr:hypothetical protein CDAR_41091 [Caerostris darwini]
MLFSFTDFKDTARRLTMVFDANANRIPLHFTTALVRKTSTSFSQTARRAHSNFSGNPSHGCIDRSGIFERCCDRTLDTCPSPPPVTQSHFSWWWGLPSPVREIVLALVTYMTHCFYWKKWEGEEFRITISCYE